MNLHNISITKTGKLALLVGMWPKEAIEMTSLNAALKAARIEFGEFDHTEWHDGFLRFYKTLSKSEISDVPPKRIQ